MEGTGCRHPAQTLASATPEKPISRAELRPGHRSLVDGELLVQGEVFEGELAMAAEEEGEESKEVEQESGHRAEIVAGSEPTDQLLGGLTGFWQGSLGASQAPVSRDEGLLEQPLCSVGEQRLCAAYAPVGT